MEKVCHCFMRKRLYFRQYILSLRYSMLIIKKQKSRIKFMTKYKEPQFLLMVIL